jgi:hypothetical protein
LAVRHAVKPQAWIRGGPATSIDDLETLDRQAVGLTPVPVEQACSKWNKRRNKDVFWPADARPVVRFLHLSDSQVRDETLSGDVAQKLQFNMWDLFVNVSVRRPFVEAFDALTLASFLVGHGKEVARCRTAPDSLGCDAARQDAFVIHTGDLLDMSVATELLETTNILRDVSDRYNFEMFSVGGNHDGLFFGNVADERTDTYSIGVNLTEFVLGHMVTAPADPKSRREDRRKGGFGFGGNEIVQRADRAPCDKDPAPLAGLDELQQGALREIHERLCERSQYDRAELQTPLVFRQAVRSTARFDNVNFHLGYYSWVRPIDAGDVQGFRFIVLDTRSAESFQGRIDTVQLGWLYNQLVEALLAHEVVLLFAHHSPYAFQPWFDVYGLGVGTKGTTKMLHAMLDRFPNIAGYFYGHEHWNEAPHPWGRGRSFSYIQTGSLADFPQVGRELAVSLVPAAQNRTTVRLDWRFVRPAADLCTPGKQLLQATLDRARKDAEKDWRAQVLFDFDKRPFINLRRIGHSLLPPFVEKFAGETTWPRIYKWDKENLKSDHVEPTVDFAASGCPSRQAVFGCAGARTVDEQRNRLGLELLTTACEQANAPVAGRRP